MPKSQLAFPISSPADPEDVIVALDTGSALWSKGDEADALRWLRRARDAADEAGNDVRALELARAAADLTIALEPSSTNSAPPSAPASAATVSPDVRRSRLPEPPPQTRKFLGALPDDARTTKATTSPSAATRSSPSNTVQERPSLRPAAPSNRSSLTPQPPSAVPRPAGSSASAESRQSTLPRSARTPAAESHANPPRPNGVTSTNVTTEARSSATTAHLPTAAEAHTSAVPRAAGSSPVATNAESRLTNFSRATTVTTSHVPVSDARPPEARPSATSTPLPTSTESRVTNFSRAMTVSSPHATVSESRPEARIVAAPQPASEAAVPKTPSPTTRLTSVSVTVERSSDGSLKAIAVENDADIDPESQAVLVLSEALWAKLRPR